MAFILLALVKQSGNKGPSVSDCYVFSQSVKVFSYVAMFRYSNFFFQDFPIFDNQVDKSDFSNILITLYAGRKMYFLKFKTDCTTKIQPKKLGDMTFRGTNSWKFSLFSRNGPRKVRYAAYLPGWGTIKG